MQKISVGIPAYNAMPYLPEAIESVLRQSYADFELIVVNDGSTDGSRAYLESIRDKRLRIIDQENSGPAAARNRLLKEARTPWLMLLDADDIAYPNRISTVTEYVRRFPETGVFYSMAEYYQARWNGRLRTTRLSAERLRRLVYAGYLPDICNSTAVLNVAKILSVGGYRPGFLVEDADLWWRVALQYDIRFIPKTLVAYRPSSQSYSSRSIVAHEVSLWYVQYLLLSHLHNRTPLAFETIRTVLEELNPSQAAFKRFKREFIVEFSKGNNARALIAGVRALLASPGRLVSRVLDGFFPYREIKLGESPARFEALCASLWPH